MTARNFAAELRTARVAEDWEAHARIWEERRLASVEDDERGIQPAQVDTKYSLVWAAEHPELFAQSVIKFHDEHPIDEWRHAVDMGNAGSITLLAFRREEAYNLERDLLRETGRVSVSPEERAALEQLLDELESFDLPENTLKRNARRIRAILRQPLGLERKP